MQGSCSIACDSLNYICHTYNFNKYELGDVMEKMVRHNRPSEDILIKCGLIRDLIEYRESHRYDPDVTELIEDLCIN